jgi:hypothetical protein
MSETSTFNFFHYTSQSCDSCCNAIDTPASSNRSDAESSEQCRNECQWLCWPLCITFDIISCPCRASHYVYHNVSCKCNTCNKKTKPVIIIQPHLHNIRVQPK